VLAAAHHPTPDKKLLDALTPALLAIDASVSSLYADYVLAALPAAARKYLEDAVNARTYEYKPDLLRRSFQEGEAKGEAKALLTVLDTRGLHVSDEVRERIASCTDPGRLEAWLRRAVTVERAEELFD